MEDEWTGGKEWRFRVPPGQAPSYAREINLRSATKGRAAVPTTAFRLRRTLAALRVAWKDDVFIDRITDEGPSAPIVRVRFCVL